MSNILRKFFNLNIFSVFIILLSIDVLINSYHYFENLKLFFYWSTSGEIKVFLYIVNYLVQIYLFALLLTSNNKVIRNLSFLILMFTLSIFLTYYFINGYGYSINEAMVAVSDFYFLGEAFNNFSSSIYKAFFISLSISIVIYWFSLNKYNKINNKILLFIIGSLVSIYIMVGTYSVSDRLFFVPFKVVFNSFNAFSAPLYNGKKNNVTRNINKSKINKIVYIVDESIVGNKLSINGYDKNTTPYLKSIQKNIVNYGIASSGANCSASSNTILRSGLMPNMLPDIEQLSMKNPNIYAYAKKAGYYTVYMDGQNEKDTPTNYMNKYSFKSIDKYYEINKCCKSKLYMNDRKMIDIIKNELLKHKKVFIYVNKVGSHFPYENDYPQDQKYFKPTLKLEEAPSLEKKNYMLNSYYNSLRWGVDSWWKIMMSKLHDINTVIIYTSDHAQNLFDTPSKQTHCSKNPTSIEANVPLMIFPLGTTKDLIYKYIQENYTKNYNRASHFNIFPTILFLEGYKLKKNEKSLFDNLSKEERYFYYGDIWNRVGKVGTKQFKVSIQRDIN